MFDGVVGLVTGLLGLARGIVIYFAGGVVVLFCSAFSIQPPQWAENGVNNVHDTVRALLDDPALLLDSIVFRTIDVIEEEGIAYAIGEAVGPIAATILTKGAYKFVKGKVHATNVKRMIAQGTGWTEIKREISRAGLSFDDLRAAGVTADDLFRAGALADDLVGIGASFDDLASAAARMNWVRPDGSHVFPPINGAVPGTEQVVTLQPQTLHRFGDVTNRTVLQRLREQHQPVYHCHPAQTQHLNFK